MLDLTTSLNIVISNQIHEYGMQLHVKVSEIWCTSVGQVKSKSLKKGRGKVDQV